MAQREQRIKRSRKMAKANKTSEAIFIGMGKECIKKKKRKL
jgi:hypothetical protein